MKKTKLSLPQNDFLTIDYQGISKQVNLQDEDYICLNDLLEFFPHKKIDNWKRLKGTKEFIKLVDAILTPSHVRELKADSKESKLRKAIYTKEGKNGGTFAHEFVALEFLTWLSPEFKLMVLVQWNRWRKEKYNPLIIKQFVVDYVREALHDLETRMREMMVNEYLQIEDFNQDIDRLNSFALHVNQQLLSLAAQQAKLKTQIETMEEEQRTEGKSWVYLLYNPKSEEYKIGYTSDLKTRQKNFQSTEPDIEIYLKIAVKTPRQALNLESFFHIEFDDKRTHGEWFRLDGNDLNKLKGFVGVLGK